MNEIKDIEKNIVKENTEVTIEELRECLESLKKLEIISERALARRSAKLNEGK